MEHATLRVPAGWSVLAWEREFTALATELRASATLLDSISPVVPDWAGKVSSGLAKSLRDHVARCEAEHEATIEAVSAAAVTRGLDPITLS